MTEVVLGLTSWPLISGARTCSTRSPRCRRAPADVVWMLRAGVHVDEACARVFAAVRGDGLAPLGWVVPTVSEGGDRPDTAGLQGGIRPVSEPLADVRSNAERSLAVGRMDRILVR
jgi:hypothetical protein